MAAEATLEFEVPATEESPPELLTEAILEASKWRVQDMRIEGFHALGPDWEGRLPSSGVIDTARRLLNRVRSSGHLPAPSAVGPSPMGSIILEWHFADSYLEAEVERENLEEWMHKPMHGEPKHWDVHVESPGVVSATTPVRLAGELRFDRGSAHQTSVQTIVAVR